MEPGSHFQLVTHRINNLEKPHRTVGHSPSPRSLRIPQYRVPARARGRLLSQRQRHQGAALVRTRRALLSPLTRAVCFAPESSRSPRLRRAARASPRTASERPRGARLGTAGRGSPQGLVRHSGSHGRVRTGAPPHAPVDCSAAALAGRGRGGFGVTWRPEQQHITASR